jgi:hypothetical protein
MLSAVKLKLNTYEIVAALMSQIEGFHFDALNAEMTPARANNKKNMRKYHR